MPVDRFILNAVEPSADGLRREGQRLLRALMQLQGRAMEVSLDLGAMNVPIQKAFEFLVARFLPTEHLDNDGLADGLEVIRDLIDDISWSKHPRAMSGTRGRHVRIRWIPAPAPRPPPARCTQPREHVP
jgi:hypothetical protein